MNFWVIISYLKVKNLSRNVAPEKCKKTAPITSPKSPRGDKTTEATTQRNNKQKTSVGTVGTPFLNCL